MRIRISALNLAMAAIAAYRSFFAALDYQSCTGSSYFTYLYSTSLARVAPVPRLAMASSDMMCLDAPVVALCWRLSYPGETGVLIHGAGETGRNSSVSTSESGR